MAVVSPMQNEASSAPKDYGEFFRRYAAHVRNVLWHQGIPNSELDEQVADLFCRWQVTGMLEQFDPGYHGNGSARFEPFLNQHIKLAAMGRRDAIQKRRIREPAILNAPVNTNRWFDTPQRGISGFVENDFEEFVVAVRCHLELIPRRSARDVCDLPLLFLRIVAQVELTGRIDQSLLAEGPWAPHKERGEIRTTVSNSIIRLWMIELRKHVKDAIEIYGISRRSSRA